MTAYEILSDYALDGVGVLILLLTVIQIAPIKINPWSKIAQGIGNALNKNLEKEITELKDDIKATNQKVDDLSFQFHENVAVDARDRILRFGDEVSHGVNHSRDHFQQILNDITDYDNYCLDHPKFKNNTTALTSERIKEDYKQRDLNNDFL